MEKATWEQRQYWLALGGSDGYWSAQVEGRMTRQQAAYLLEGFRDKQYQSGEISKVTAERKVPA